MYKSAQSEWSKWGLCAQWLEGLLECPFFMQHVPFVKRSFYWLCFWSHLPLRVAIGLSRSVVSEWLDSNLWNPVAGFLLSLCLTQWTALSFRSSSCDSYFEPWQTELADMRLRLSPQERDTNMFSEEDDTVLHNHYQVSVSACSYPTDWGSTHPIFTRV